MNNFSLIGWQQFFASGGGVGFYFCMSASRIGIGPGTTVQKNCQIKFLKQIGRQLELDKFWTSFFLHQGLIRQIFAKISPQTTVNKFYL